MSEQAQFQAWWNSQHKDPTQPVAHFAAWQAAKESSRKELEAAKQRIAELEEAVRQQKERCEIMKSNAQSLEQETREEKEALEKKWLSEQGRNLRDEAEWEINCQQIVQLERNATVDTDAILALRKKLEQQATIFNAVLDPRKTSLDKWHAEIAAARAEGFKEGKLAGRDEAQKVPDGWQLVPLDPTDNMTEAAHAAGWSRISIYQAMLAAAPTYKKEEA